MFTTTHLPPLCASQYGPNSSWLLVVELLFRQEPRLGCFLLLEHAFVISGGVEKEQLYRSAVLSPTVCPHGPGREPAIRCAAVDAECTVPPGFAVWVGGGPEQEL